MKFNKTKPIALGIAFTLALTPIHAITYADTNSDSASINVQTAQTEYKSGFVERFPELSLFYRLFSPLNSEMICIFPYFCPYAESAREIRGIFVALHINNWFSEPILI